MITHSKNLLVWQTSSPAILLLPPYTIHAVFTYTLSCHTGVRATLSIWKDSIKNISTIVNSPSHQIQLKKNKVDREEWLHRTVPDLRQWIGVFEELEREPNEKEEEMMSVLIPFIKPTVDAIQWAG